jgi:hypothetical protein
MEDAGAARGDKKQILLIVAANEAEICLRCDPSSFDNLDPACRSTQAGKEKRRTSSAALPKQQHGQHGNDQANEEREKDTHK